jgi:hypothetical protein
LNLSFKVHGAIVTGPNWEDNPTTAFNALESKLNPVIKGYDWSNVVAVEHSKDAGCPAYCPIGKYDIDAYKASLTPTKDPCHCVGIDLTDWTYPYCYCSVAANALNFPCACMDATAKTFTWVTDAGTTRVAEPGAVPTAAEKCNCRRPAAGATGTDETQTADSFRACKR